jgi:hypothetical protein
MPERIKLIISIVQQVVYIVLYILCIYQLVMFFVHDNLYDKLISLMMSGSLFIEMSLRTGSPCGTMVLNTLMITLLTIYLRSHRGPIHLVPRIGPSWISTRTCLLCMDRGGSERLYPALHGKHEYRRYWMEVMAADQYLIQ